MRLTILRKGLILISLPLLLQLAFIWSMAALQRWQGEAQRLVLHSRGVRLQARLALQGLLDAETGQRGFLLTGEPAFAGPYERATREVPDRLARLRELVADSPGQAARVAALAADAERLIAWYAHTNDLVRAGPADRAAAVSRQGGGKARMDDLRRQVEAFEAEEEQRESQMLDALARARANLEALLLLGSGAVLAAVLCLGYVFHRGVSRRVAALGANVRRLAAGEALVPPLGGRDELAELDRAFHDLAARLRQSQEALRAQNAELDERVRRRTAELADVNRDLTEKNREVELFVYSVSHDLRAPLVNLEGFSRELDLAREGLAELLAGEAVPPAVRERARALLDNDTAECLRYIRAAVRRLGRIIDALLRLSRVGRVEYRWQRVDVAALVARVVASYRATSADKGAEVTVGDLPPAWGDVTALEQVFANLLGNALNYLEPGRPGRVEVGALAPAAGAAPAGANVYYVRDNGTGIPAEYQHKVFQAFQRCHPEAAPGEGIGLSIVRRTVERHRGRVWLESAAGEGTAVYLTLPREGTPDAGPGGPATPAGGLP